MSSSLNACTKLSRNEAGRVVATALLLAPVSNNGTDRPRHYQRRARHHHGNRRRAGNPLQLSNIGGTTRHRRGGGNASTSSPSLALVIDLTAPTTILYP